jgi:hypothetical protein
MIIAESSETHDDDIGQLRCDWALFFTLRDGLTLRHTSFSVLFLLPYIRHFSLPISPQSLPSDGIPAHPLTPHPNHPTTAVSGLVSKVLAT